MHLLTLKVEGQDGLGMKNLFDFHEQSIIYRSDDTFGLCQYRFD